MAQTESMSIAIRPELMEAVARYAATSRKPIDAVADEALSFYIECNDSANEIRRCHLDRAHALGLEIEDYIARMIKEWRREDRELELSASRSS